MGKSYVENSLKRFLKRKVKITLGLVVTFMITGMVSLGADKPVEEMNDFEKAEHYLAGLNNEDNKLENLMTSFQDVTNGTEGIKLDKAKNEIVLEKFKNNGTGNIVISLKNENISNETAKNIKTALENGAKNINNIGRSSKGINEGILLGDNIIMGGSSKNNGIIYSNLCQRISNNNTAYNNGIIIFNSAGQIINFAENKGEKSFSLAYNNGIIVSSGIKDSTKDAQIIHNWSNNSSLINNGTIINGNQIIKGGNNNNLYNYGVIEDGYQEITIYGSNGSAINSNAYNYGIIKSNSTFGQIIKSDTTSKSHIKNYGIMVLWYYRRKWTKNRSRKRKYS